MEESTKKSIKNLFRFLGIWIGVGILLLIFFIAGQETGDKVLVVGIQVMGFIWFASFFTGLLAVCIDDINMKKGKK